VPLVRVDNQRPMGDAVADFALYLQRMHATIHPAFASRFLDADATSDVVDDVSLVRGSRSSSTPRRAAS
jgi:hypothetical protein